MLSVDELSLLEKAESGQLTNMEFVLNDNEILDALLENYKEYKISVTNVE